MNKKDARDKAEVLLAKVGLAERLTHRPNQLSGGEQQMLAMARVLVGAPKLVLVDEPSEGLAPMSKFRNRIQIGRAHV